MTDKNQVSKIAVAIFYWMMVNNLDSGVSEGVSSAAATVSAPAVTMSIRPTPQWEGTLDALISFRSTNADNYTSWTRSLETFLNVYRLPGLAPGRGQNIVNCGYDQPLPPGMVCDVDVRHWYPCVSENHFGYHRATPCVFLKIDTPPGWIPEYYNDTSSLPTEMPADLKSYITNSGFSRNELNTVWVSCEGVYPADLEFIGPIKFIPRRGFPGYYFLNNQADGFLSPLVALHIERPYLGIVINIKCKAWARNIDHNAETGTGGGVQFSLMID